MNMKIKPKALVLAVSSLLACGTLAASVKLIEKSYYQTEIQQHHIENHMTTALTAPLQTISVSITESGALYVGKIRDDYFFWVIHQPTNRLVLVEHITIDPQISQVLQVELFPKTTAVFYSDELITSNQSTPIVFKGDLIAGKIAMPIDYGYFTQLKNAVSDVGDSVIIDASQNQLLTILNRQEEIFEAVDKVNPLIVDDIENFKSKASQAVLSLKKQVETNEQYGEARLEEYESMTLGYQQQFLDQLDSDLMTLQNSSNDLTENINKQVTHYTTRVIPCIENLDAKMTREMTAVISRLDIEDQNEDLNEAAENLIDQTELSMDRQALQMEECIGGLTTIENYDSNNIISEEKYLSLNSSTELLEQRIDQEITSWSDDMQSESDNLVSKINTDELVERTLSYETMFDRWLSPRVLQQKHLITQPKAELEEALETRGGEEMLCEDETFNIEFNIGGMTVVLGTPFDDNIVTGNKNNLILSFSGDDCIESHAGYDVVLSGTGEDTIYAGDDHDLVHGGQGNDEIHGSAGNDYSFNISGVEIEVNIGNLLMGGAGNDSIFGGEVDADRGENGTVENNGFTDIILGDSFLFGDSAGDDVIMGEMGVDFIFGQAGNDTLSNVVPGAISVAGIPRHFGSFFFGNSGDDKITGSNTNTSTSSLGDFAFGNDGNDTINLGDGRDFGFGNQGNDTINGQDGMDFIFGNLGNDSINGGRGIDLIFGGRDHDIMHGNEGVFDLIFGGRGRDRLFGDEGVDLIFGSQDVDTINGNKSFDLIFGGDAGDIIHGDEDLDIIFGNNGVDTLFGDDGMDLIFGNNDSDTLFGGDDTDVMFGNSNTNENSVETLWGGNGIDIMFGNTGIDRMYGQEGIDLMFGNNGDDEMYGGNGQDIMFGNTGNDYIDGQNDIDVLFGNDGNDRILGGSGQDLGFGNNGCDIMNGGDDTDLFFGNSNNDIISGDNGLDVLFGNGGSDEVRGNANKDMLFGNDGNDYVNGGSDLDLLFGNSGNDHMMGGSSKDIMFGNSGNDYMNGGTGGDVMFGNTENDIMDGGNDNDLIFGNRGHDKINSGYGTDWTWGNRDNDRMRSVEGKNFAFGNRGNDTLDGYRSGGSDSRDRMWGNRNNDNITGNKNNQRDRRYGGWGSDSKSWNTTFISASEFNVTWTTPACDF